MKTLRPFETSLTIYQSTRCNSPEHVNLYQSPKLKKPDYLNILQYRVFTFRKMHGNPGRTEDERWRSPSNSTNNLIYRPQKGQNLLRSSVSFKINVLEHNYKTNICSIKIFFFFAIRNGSSLLEDILHYWRYRRPHFLPNTDESFALWKIRMFVVCLTTL
jgi:hypothetical protein